MVHYLVLRKGYEYVLRTRTRIFIKMIAKRWHQVPGTRYVLYDAPGMASHVKYNVTKREEWCLARLMRMCYDTCLNRKSGEPDFFTYYRQLL